MSKLPNRPSIENILVVDEDTGEEERGIAINREASKDGDSNIIATRDESSIAMAASPAQSDDSSDVWLDNDDSLRHLANRYNIDVDELIGLMQTQTTRSGITPHGTPQNQGSSSSAFLEAPNGNGTRILRSPGTFSSPRSPRRDGSGRSRTLPVGAHQVNLRRSQSSQEFLVDADHSLQKPLTRTNSGVRSNRSSVADLASMDGSSTPLVARSPSKASSRPAVRFGKNAIKDVVVYEVDDTLYVDVEFQRNKLGWVLLFLAFVEGTLWDAYGIYSLKAAPNRTDANTVGFWVSVAKLPMFLAMCLIMIATGMVEMDEFKRIFRQFKFGMLTLLFGIFSSLGIILQVVAVMIDDKHTPSFTPTVNLSFLWVLMYRRFWKKQDTFFAEWMGALVAILGYTVASARQWVSTEAIGLTLATNAVMTVCSMMIATWLLLTEWCSANSPSIFVTMFPLAFTDLVLFFVVGLVMIGPSNLVSAGMFDMFTAEHAPTSALLGLGGFMEMMLYLGSARYLDVLSISAVFALKSVAVPYAEHFWYAPSDKRSWNLWLWIGTPVVLGGCLLIIIFASVKRQFIERRQLAANGGWRRVGNPYNRRSGEFGPNRPGAVQRAGSSITVPAYLSTGPNPVAPVPLYPNQMSGTR